MASETTPLLPATNGAENTFKFPSILSAAQRLPSDPSLFDFQSLYPHSLGQAQPLRAVAFRLLLVLHLLVSDNDNSLSRRQNTIQALRATHEQERRRDNLRHIASAILGHVPGAIADTGLPGTTEGIPEDISVEYILLSPFPKYPLSSQMLRVIDLLARPAIPTAVLTDQIISLSLIRLWKYGEVSLDPLPESSLHRVLRIYDSASTPRAIHAVHMIAHLAYLVLLANLTIYPSPRPILVETPGGPIGFREPIIAIYSISNIVFTPFSSSTVPHVSVLFSLLISLPTSPSPDTISYSLLLLALCLHILFVQFPSYPSLPLLFEPTRCLPLSSLYVACVTRYLIPAFVFLLPILLASTVLLSLSLSGPVTNGQTVTSGSTAPPSVFLALFCIGCFLVLYFSISALLLSPSPFQKDENGRHWERYGSSVGIAGRRSLIRAILAYSPLRQHYNLACPPPLNLLSLPLVILPLLPRGVYIFLLRLVVGPFAFVAAGFWGWGLL